MPARPPRDPAWTADGYVSERWMPVSPVSGRLDAFQWKVPLAELGDDRDVIETGEMKSADKPPIAAPLPAVQPPALPASPPVTRPAEAVIPLLHVPDDPGPEPVPDADPEPVPPGASRGARLFK